MSRLAFQAAESQNDFFMCRMRRIRNQDALVWISRAEWNFRQAVLNGLTSSDSDIGEILAELYERWLQSCAFAEYWVNNTEYTTYERLVCCMNEREPGDESSKLKNWTPQRTRAAAKYAKAYGANK